MVMMALGRYIDVFRRESESMENQDVKVNYFSNPRTNKLIVRAREKLEKQINEESRGSTAGCLYRFTHSALHEFQVRGEDYDDACGYNKSVYGDHFNSYLERYIERPTGIDALFGCCYRFVCEYEFVAESGLGSNLSNEKGNLVDIDFGDFADASFHYSYANTQMSMQLLRRVLNHPDVRSFSNFEKFIAGAISKFKDFEAEYERKIVRIKELEGQLKKNEQDYNFAKLNQGFYRLKSAKLGEKKYSFWGAVFMGFALIVLPGVKLFNLLPSPTDEFGKVIALIVAVGAELLLIYFFRIFLANFRSVSQQILQIDLRMTLCSFIESYSDFALEARKSDKDVLNKFEQIVFSEVSFGDAALPSAYEGIEHISSVFGKIKSK